MADRFIGLSVFLTLKDPDQTQVRGLVANVVSHELLLTDGLLLLLLLHPCEANASPFTQFFSPNPVML